MQKKLTASNFFAAFCIFLLIPMFSACSSGISTAFSSNQPDYPKAEMVFEAHLSEPLPEGTSLYFEVLDDVTGLYFNSSRHSMAAMDDLNYYIRIPLMVSSEVKYRYVRIQENAQYEANSLNQQVRYRIARVDGPNIVHDEITGWLDQPYVGGSGRITGQAIDRRNNSPIPNLLVTAGGLQTITASDGTFIFEKVSPGLHNLVIYSMDGSYETFQQDALVSEGAMTPVQVFLDQREMTNVTFTVKLPDDYSYDPDLPLRFVSNLHSLGNAYTELAGGSTGNAANYPEMEKVDDQIYRIKLSLPVGTYLRYKYSLGDGFWNSELDASGNFAIRDLLVTKNHDPKDLVTTFLSPGFQPVSVNIQVPPETPVNENVTLQLNPFGWMEPLPMVQGTNNQWKFTVYSPLHLLREIGYRFCRNGDCSSGAQNGTQGSSFLAGTSPTTISETIKAWSGLTLASGYPVLTSAVGISPRPGFVTAVALKSFPPSIITSRISSALDSVQKLGANTVVFSPTWTITDQNPLSINPLLDQDLLWNQLGFLSQQINKTGLQQILYPKINYTQDGLKYIVENRGDSTWKEDWFSKYSRFMLHNADLASTQAIPYLVIGEPALSQIPDSEENWARLINDIRARYKGQIAGIAAISSNGTLIPTWLNQVDVIYVLMTPDLSDVSELSTEALMKKYDEVLNSEVLPIYQEYGKPILVNLEIPSSKGALLGKTLEALDSPDESYPFDGSLVDTQLQAMIYDAAIISAGRTQWISGFVTDGYAPFLAVTDTSPSVYMKPANDPLWFWYHYLLNK